MYWVVALLALILTACGGGGGSPSPGGASSPPPLPRTGLKIGYFETSDGQLAATHAAVNIVHCQDDSAFGDPDARAWREAQIILCLQRAQSFGIKAAIVSVGFEVFDARFRYIGTTTLQAFHDEIVNLGLDGSIVALYPLDEPDIHGVSEKTMDAAIDGIRRTWPGPKIWEVYGNTGATPGSSRADAVGRDDYGGDALHNLPPIRPDQQYIILPGGADPWRNDPSPFYRFALATPQVTAIWSFIYGSYDGIHAGIGGNGMLPEYQSVGCAITLGC